MSNQKPARPGTAKRAGETRNQNKIKGLIFVVSGPSGSGKTTLLEKVLKRGGLKNKLVKSVSFTTRPKRSGEQNNQDYLFVSENVFKQKLKTNKLLEWTKYLGYYYATPKEFLEEKLTQGKNLILCLDLKGALKIKQLYPQNTVTIFIQPPSLGQLQNRIEKRCSKTKKEEIQKRLKLAKEELLSSSRYDYCLVNRDLTDTAKQLRQIVLKETASKLS